MKTDIRSERRFQIFGCKQEAELSTHSFSSSVNSVLWKTNNVLLQVAEDFYRSERLCHFSLLPEALDQWADSMQQRLLGYQEQTRAFLSRSREELVKQLSAFCELLNSLPDALIGNHEQQHEQQLREEVGGVRRKLEEILAASEKQKSLNIHRLRASLSQEELNTLNSREELRQQQLHSTICRAHLELQERVRARGEEFVTSLASLSEKLLHQLDDLLTPAVSEDTDAAVTPQPTEDSAVTMETGAKAGRKQGRGSSSADPPSSVTMATTASTTTAKCVLKRVLVIQHRDAAAKRFEQLVGSESSRSDEDKRSRLSEENTWNTHWKQQIHTLKHA
ncbi:coiled-coil domain-containing protein 180-like [Leuresthes tenuis]|uniref:coiled-coil domain-containing protein 180-like n=1 Tax=Leuresthes tenuis TaxID=355514 RepID=UPI003B50C06D